MGLVIDWAAGTIEVPKVDTTQIAAGPPTEIRTYDLNVFRLELRDLEDDPDGRPWPNTHSHNEDVLVSGVTLPDVVLLSDYYTWNMEDGQYVVQLLNANSNLLDRIVSNQVSVIATNTTGPLQSAASLTVGDIADAVWSHLKALTLGKWLGLR